MFSEKLRTRETPSSVKSSNFFNDSQPLLHFCIPLAHHKYLKLQTINEDPTASLIHPANNEKDTISKQTLYSMKTRLNKKA